MVKSDYRFASTLNPYGLDKNNNLVCVDDVPNGLDCGCVCPACKVDLIAKQGDERVHHFAHSCDDKSCLHIQETYFQLTKQILENNKYIMLPEYDIIKSEKIAITNITLQNLTYAANILPDIVVETEIGMQFYIRFKRKRGKDISFDRNNVYLELDANNIKLNELESFLLYSTENKNWLNNPFYDKYLEQEYQTMKSAISQIDNSAENNELNGIIEPNFVSNKSWSYDKQNMTNTNQEMLLNDLQNLEIDVSGNLTHKNH